MNTPTYSCRWRARSRFLALATLSLFAAQAAFAQTTAPAADKKDETVKLEKFTVTGSFIPQATAEPIAPVAIFSEADIRATGAMTPIQALRSLPSFIGNPGPTENDSNGASGATFVSLRGQGAGQTLVLLDGRPAGNQSNIQMLPIEAITRIEVLRDGAGIIYGSAAIGGAVNVILKKNYNGLTVNLQAGGASRSPGSRETFQASFVAGASNDKTAVVISGSYFKNRTIYSGQRPNSAEADNRPRGGVNGGSPTFAGNVSSAALGTVILKPSFGANSTPTGAADYVTMDQNGASSAQLFNFREYSPSAPGQKRNSLYFNIEHKVFDKSLEVFGTVFYSKLSTLNGLAPAPFALSVDPVLGPANGSLMQWGPYNNLLGAFKLQEDDTDFIRYRSVELGNRTNEQVFNDFKYIVGLRGEDGNSCWEWETSYTIDNEQFRQLDAGVPSLPLLDAEVKAGRFNPFALAFSKGTAGGSSWDNAAALKAAEVTARQLTDSLAFTYNARVSGSLFELPAGEVGMAAGMDYAYGDNRFDADDLYASGSVLGLNAFGDTYNEARSRSLFAEIKVPILSGNNKVKWVHDLSFGALARKELQTVKGTHGITSLYDSRSYDKTNPSVNLQFSPTPDYKFRATWSKGFLAPPSGLVFATPGTSNPTLADPLGFPTTAQTTIVIRGNDALAPAISKAWSLGFVAQPKDFVKNLSLTVDFYNIKVDGIIANNANQILAANAAGQGAGFVPGNAATINPAAPFASQIRRLASGRLNSSGSFGIAGIPRGAVLSDFLNIASRDVSGIEYTATYTMNTTDWGRFTFIGAANQFIKFKQATGAGVPLTDYLGRSVSTVGDPISPGSIPKWKGNLSTRWSWKNLTANVTFNHIGAYEDDPLFIMSAKQAAFYAAGTPKSDPAYTAFLNDPTQLKVGGKHTIAAFDTFDVQVGCKFSHDNRYTSGLSVSLNVLNVFDKLAPFAGGAFNDSYDTRTHNNIGRFVQLTLTKEF